MRSHLVNGEPTFVFNKASVILYIEIRKSAVNMSADFLTCFCSAKDSDYRNLGLLRYLRWFDITSKGGIELGRRRLVMIDAVQPNTKEIHHG